MSNVNDIEQAIRKLSPNGLAELRAWFAQFDADAWDRQLERDVDKGRLNQLADNALADLREGRCKEL